MPAFSYRPTPITTAQNSRGGSGGGTGFLALAVAPRSRVTVRTSCRVVPSGSRAVRMIVLVPSRSVTGAVTTTERGVDGSAWRSTSVPLSVTVVLATPRLELTTAVTTVCSSVMRAPSAG